MTKGAPATVPLSNSATLDPMRFLAALFLCSFLSLAQQPGQPLPPWTPGTLDIHQINTGRGNAAFLIFPDGTTMLLDAGDGGNTPPRGTTPKPDASRTPAEWITRYIRHMLPHEPDPTLDYGYLTHFHDDHMGALTKVGLPIKLMLD